MAAILVTYDLKTPGQDYSTLHKAIKEAGSSWWHYLESTWIVGGSGITASSVNQVLRPLIDDNDNLFCVDISGDAYAGWLNKKAWEWMRQWV